MGRAARIRWLAAGAVVLAVIGGLVLRGLYARGFWDESRAVHIKPREIENSTLAIGTHLIHLSALNDSIYEIAEKSAEESGQSQIFYKSELGGGAWFDISSASSLNDITVGGSPVTDEEMEALFFTHHTKSDGVTYDLRTGEAVNIFDIRDPYDLESMEELSPLKLYYDQLVEIQGETDTTKRIDEFWQTPVSGDEGPAGVREREKELSGLQIYLNALNARGADSRETEKVTSVMGAVDAARRYAVFEVLEYELEKYLNEELGQPAPPAPPPAEEETVEEGDEASEETAEGAEGSGSENAEGGDGGESAEGGGGESAGGGGGENAEGGGENAEGGDSEESAEGGDSEEGDEGGDSEEDESSSGSSIDPEKLDQNLLSAVSESLSNVKNSLIEYEGKMLSEGQTVMSRAEYEYSNDLIAHADAGSESSCDRDVEKLILLDNILNDVISDRPKELALLEETLIGEATSEYMAALNQGETAEYRAQAAKNASRAVLNRFINEGAAAVDARRGELEFLTEAKCLRLDAASGMEYIDGLLGTVDGFAEVIPSDAFRSGSVNSVDAFASFLANKRRALELASGGNLMDELNAEKDDLQAKRLSALDKNDLAGAKALAEQIAGVEEEIRALEAESAAQMGALQDRISALEAAGDLGGAAAAKAELANLEKSLSDGSLGSLVTQLKRDALDAIAAGRSGLGGSSGTGGGGGGESGSGGDGGSLGSGDGGSPGSGDGGPLGSGDGGSPGSGDGGSSGSGGGGSSGSGDGGSSGGAGAGSSGAGPSGGAGTGSGGGAEASANALAAQDAVDALSGLLPTSPKLVLPAMQEIYNALLLNGGDQGLIDSLEQAVLENPSALREDLSAGALRSLVDGFDGGEVSKLLGLELYYQETGSQDALRLLSGLARKEAGMGNALVFERVQDGTGEYLPLKAIQAVTGWRFVWEKNSSLGVLARGREYYGFTLYSVRVVRDRDETQTEQMDRMAKNKGGIHIPEEYADTRFGVQACYLSGTTLGCAYDGAAMDEARELLALLLAA